MNAIQTLLHHQFAERLGWSLIHLLWQGAVLAFLLIALLWLLRRRSANARYLAAGMTLLLLPVSLAGTFAMLSNATPAKRAGVSFGLFGADDESASGTSKGNIRTDSAATANVVREPTELSNLDRGANRGGPATEATGSAITGTSSTEKPTIATDEPARRPAETSQKSDAAPEPWLGRAIAMIEFAIPGIVGGWLIGLLVLSVWHIGGWVVLQRLRVYGVTPVSDAVRHSLNRLRTRLGIRRNVEVLQSSRIPVPSLMGFLKPVILIPGSVLTGLSPSQLEAILAHELAHVRRHDYLFNLVQTGIEALLFFHPAVWWISRRIRIERENCCDDLAVTVTENRLNYAQSLTRLEELRQASAAARPLRITVAASGGSLLDRICRVLGRPRRATARSRVNLIGATGLSGILTLGTVLLLSMPGMFVPSVTASANTTAKSGDDDKTKPDHKPIDLGKKRVHFEKHLRDKLPAKLFAVAEYPTDDLPSVKHVYEQRLNNKLRDGYHELVGRVPRLVFSGMILEPSEFTRSGRKITVRIRHVNPFPGGSLSSHAYYFRAPLRTAKGKSLPPGKYNVRVIFDDCRKTNDGELVPIKDSKEPSIKPLTCEFVVPKEALANASSEKATGWHPLIKGKMATVSVAESLYEKQSEKHFLTRVRVTNRTDRELGVDLMGRRYGVRLNQWGVFSLPERGIIDETRIERKPFQAADKASLLAAFRARKLARIPAGKSIEFYCPFNGTENASVRKSIKAAKGKFLILSMDGEVRVTDGKSCEVLGCGEPGDADVVLPRPVSWKKVPGDARILGDRLAAIEGKKISPAKWNPRADRRPKPGAYEKNTTANFTKRDELIRSLPLENMPAGDIRFPLSRWFEQSQKADVSVTTSENNWLLFRSKQADDQEKMWITSIKRDKNTFTIRMTRSVWLGNYTRNIRFHDIFGVNLGKLPAGKYKAKWIIDRASHMHFDKDGWPTDGGVVKKNAVELTVGFSVVPSKKTAATNDAPKDQFRFLVIQGHVKFPENQKVAIDRNVKVGVPFDLRPRDGLRAKGLLKRTQTGELRFMGHVSMFTTSGPIEGPVKLGQPISPNGLGFGSIIIPFFVRFERPKPAKTSKIVLKAIKSSKDRGTLRDAYQKKRRRKVATRDEMLYAHLPLDRIYQYIDLDGWFDLNKKAKPTPRTDDGNHWLMFRSQPLNDNDREWIERVERTGNRFTITLQRGIWEGAYAENQMFHDVFGVNLGKLKPGKFAVTWIVRESHFTEFDKDRWPKNAKPTKSTELKTSFNVDPIRKKTR